MSATATASPTIRASVGHRGKNLPDDVRTIQGLLNAHVKQTAKPLIVDGISGRKTVNAIIDFQRAAVRMRRPDGRVDPHGATIKTLANGSGGKRDATAAPSTPSGTTSPSPRHSTITTKQFYSLGIAMSGSMPGVRGETIKAGDILQVDGEKRLILAIYVDTVFYCAIPGGMNQVFVMDYKQFLGDVHANLWHQVHDNTKFWIPLIEAEMHFLLGVCTAASGTAFAAKVGIDVVQFVVKHRKDIPKWARATVAFFVAEQILTHAAPTVYNKLMKGLGYSILVAGVAAVGLGGRNIPRALAKDPNKAMFIAGSLLGTLGKGRVTGAFSAVGSFVKLLLKLLIKPLTALPKGVALGVRQKEVTARRILDFVRNKLKVSVTKEEAVKMVAEVETNFAEVKTALRILHDGFKGL